MSWQQTTGYITICNLPPVLVYESVVWDRLAETVMNFLRNKAVNAIEK